MVHRHFESLDIGGSTHRLRHSAATSLAAVALDPYAVAAFLGHASLTSSLTYVASSGVRLGAAIDQMPDPRSSVVA
jgi:integrase